MDGIMTRTSTPDAIPVPRMPRRWFKAMRHFKNLIANKEDTSQVFHITHSLNGNDLYKAFNRFIADPEGRKRFEERRYLPPILDDREDTPRHAERLTGGRLLHLHGPRRSDGSGSGRRI